MRNKELIIKWGVIGGAVSIIVGLVTYLLGMTDSKMIQYLGVILMLAFIVFGLFEYRDKLGNGFASFGDLFKTGLLIGLIIAIISTVWLYISISIIDTEMIGRLLLETEIKMEEQNLPQKDLDYAMEMTKKFFVPMMLVSSFASTLFISGFVSLVSSLVIKNNNPEVE